MLAMCWMLAAEHDGKLPSLADMAFRFHTSDREVLIQIAFLSHWLIDDASNVLAERKQLAPESCSEIERESEEETERDIDQKEDGWPKDYRERFWAEYPRKVGRKAALAKLEGVRKSGEVGFDVLLAAIKSIDAKDEKFIPHPTTWLNQGRYLDGSPTTSFVAPDNIAELRARYELRKAAQS